MSSRPSVAGVPWTGGHSASIKKPLRKNPRFAMKVVWANRASRSRRKSRSPAEDSGATGAMPDSAPRHWSRLRFGSLLMRPPWGRAFRAGPSVDADLHALSELQRGRLEKRDFDEKNARVFRLAGILRLEPPRDDRVGDLLDPALPGLAVVTLGRHPDGVAEAHASGVKLVELGLDARFREVGHRDDALPGFQSLASLGVPRDHHAVDGREDLRLGEHRGQPVRGGGGGVPPGARRVDVPLGLVHRLARADGLVPEG